MLVALTALVWAGAIDPGSAAPSSVGGPDAFNDQVNPVLGLRPPVVGYQFSSIDIRSWSLSADGATLNASVTVSGSVRGALLQLVGGTTPGLMVLFESPRLPQCDPCDYPRDGGYRIGVYFEPTWAVPCGGTDYSKFVVWDPYFMQPLTLARNVPYEISEDQHTITWHLPYSFEGYDIAQAGDVLTNVSAHSMTWTAQGTYCAYAETSDGTTDWAPASSWESLQRLHRPTGLNIQA